MSATLRREVMTRRSRFSMLMTAGLLLFEIAGASPVAQTPASTGSSEPKYSESIEYTWPEQRVAVEFDRVSPDSAWLVTLRDSWRALEQSKEPEKNWGKSASRCTRQECLKFLDVALTRFQTAKPGNKISGFALEMQLESEIWSHVLASVRRSLSGLKGYNPGG